MRPDGTELLPEGGGVPRAAATQPAPATTLRGATGERATLDDNPGEGNLGATGRRGWRRPVVGMALVVALAAIGVGVAVRGRPPSEASVSAAAPAGATTAAPPAPPASAATTISAAPPAPPMPAEKPAPAPPPVEAPAAPATAPPVVVAPKISPPVRLRRHEHHELVGAKTPPEPEHKAGAKPPGVTKPPPSKPNCSPNFYFDAQGDKHFKPECF